MVGSAGSKVQVAAADWRRQMATGPRYNARMQELVDHVVRTIRRAIPDAEVYLDSPDGQHFQAVVVSASFAGMPLVRQHQSVMNALKADLDANRVHALQLKTMTPEQFNASSQASERQEDRRP